MTDYKKLVSALRVDPFEVESEGLAKVMNAAADAIETLQDKFKELGELLDEASVAADVSEMRVEELQAEVKKAAKRNAELHAELEKWVSAAEKAGEPKRGEIVRCKDCKHRDPEDKGCDCAGHEMLMGGIIPMPDDWFCADGEREVQDESVGSV